MSYFYLLILGRQQTSTCRINTMDAAVLATGPSLSVFGFIVTSRCSPILRTGATKLEVLLRCWQREVNHRLFHGAALALPIHVAVKVPRQVTFPGSYYAVYCPAAASSAHALSQIPLEPSASTCQTESYMAR